MVSKFFVAALILTLAWPSLMAEQPVRFQTPGTIPPGWQYSKPRPVTIRSGYIFAGTVKAVERAVPKGNGIATVQITFHVDNGIRGVRTGQLLAIREWAGLWQSGERYCPGERVLLFLYPPSKLGLTSPVQGPMGRFRIGPDGLLVLDPGRIGFPAPHSGFRDQIPRRTRLSPVEFVRLLRSAEEE